MSELERLLDAYRDAIEYRDRETFVDQRNPAFLHNLERKEQQARKAIVDLFDRKKNQLLDIFVGPPPRAD